MDRQSLIAVTEMLNGFEQGSRNPDLFLRTLGNDLDGIREDAIQVTAQRFRTGEVEGQSLDFAPSMPRFVSEVRKEVLRMEARERPKLPPPPDNEPPEPHVPKKWVQAWADWIGGRISGARFTEITGKKVE